MLSSLVNVDNRNWQVVGYVHLDFSRSAFHTIQYDTIYLRALKSWRNGQLSLVHGIVSKNKENYKQKLIS